MNSIHCPECSVEVPGTAIACPECNFPVSKLMGLSSAILTNNRDMVAGLIQLGADVNSVDKNGRTPLMIASSIGSTEIVQMLMAAGARAEFVNQAGETALSTARTRDVEKILRRAVVVSRFISLHKKEPQQSTTPSVEESQPVSATTSETPMAPVVDNDATQPLTSHDRKIREIVPEEPIAAQNEENPAQEMQTEPNIVEETAAKPIESVDDELQEIPDNLHEPSLSFHFNIVEIQAADLQIPELPPVEEFSDVINNEEIIEETAFISPLMVSEPIEIAIEAPNDPPQMEAVEETHTEIEEPAVEEVFFEIDPDFENPFMSFITDYVEFNSKTEEASPEIVTTEETAAPVEEPVEVQPLENDPDLDDPFMRLIADQQTSTELTAWENRVEDYVATISNAQEAASNQEPIAEPASEFLEILNPHQPFLSLQFNDPQDLQIAEPQTYEPRAIEEFSNILNHEEIIEETAFISPLIVPEPIEIATQPLAEQPEIETIEDTPIQEEETHPQIEEPIVEELFIENDPNSNDPFMTSVTEQQVLNAQPEIPETPIFETPSSTQSNADFNFEPSSTEFHTAQQFQSKFNEREDWIELEPPTWDQEELPVIIEPNEKETYIPEQYYYSKLNPEKFIIGITSGLCILVFLMFLTWPAPNSRLAGQGAIRNPLPDQSLPKTETTKRADVTFIPQETKPEPKPIISESKATVKKSPTKRADAKQWWIKKDSSALSTKSKRKTQQPAAAETASATLKKPEPTRMAVEDIQKSQSLNNEGMALIRQGRPGEAIPLLEKSLRSSSKGKKDVEYASALLNLGIAWRMAGRPDIAIPILEKRIKINNQRDEVARELKTAKDHARDAGFGSFQ